MVKRILSEKSKAYLYSSGNIERMRKQGYKKGQSSPFKGEKWEHHGGYRYPGRGNVKTPEMLVKMSEKMIGEKNPMFGISLEQNRKRMKENNPMKNKELSEITHKKIGVINKEKFKDNVYKMKMIKKWALGRTKPTKPEKTFISIIEKYNLPYKYVGNGKYWIGMMITTYCDDTSIRDCYCPIGCG